MRLDTAFRSLASFALVAAISAPLAAQTTAITRPDQALRDAMTAGFRTEAASLRATADLDTLALGSSSSLFAGAVALPPADDMDGALRGEAYALVYLDGTDAAANPGTGYYRLALGSDGEANLLTATGATAATGHATFDLSLNLETRRCAIDFPHPDDAHLFCIVCNYGPGSGWSVSTCLKMFDPFHPN
ncbi:MAG TPA: hypothetical protein VN783_02680 [Thermoanaerobaculia bacterium]|nr:hypothetical protein [Thermoanaerobaculia bacterium]